MTNDEVIRKLQIIADNLEDEEELTALDKACKALTDAKTLRNELCIRCGRYEEAYKGACEGCRWENYD